MSEEQKKPNQLRAQLLQAHEAIEELRSKLVEQEHRALPILKTFFIERRNWPEGDPRREAALKALLWRIFFSPGTVAATGGLVGLATIVLLAGQLFVLREQNRELARSVDLTQEQFQRTRRTELIAALYEVVETPEGHVPKATARTRGEAAIELVNLERMLRKRGSTVAAVLSKETGAITPSLPGWPLPDEGAPMPPNLRGALLSSTDLAAVNLAGTDLSGADFAGANLSGTEFVDAILIAAKLSDATLQEANLKGAYLQGADLRRANLYQADLANARLNEANLSGSRLDRAQLEGAILELADLRGASLFQARLSGALLDHAILDGAIFDCDQIRQARNWLLARGVDHCAQP